VWVSPGATLSLEGAIDNGGTIFLATGLGAHPPKGDPGYATLFIGENGVTLTGGGKIVLGAANSPDVRIVGDAAQSNLVNIDDTIEGGGQIGEGELALTNGPGGVIASLDRLTLTLNTGLNIIFNGGLIEAEDASYLAITGFVNNVGGTIAAVDEGTVTLQSANISGGTLSTTAGASIIAEGSTLIDPGESSIVNAGLLEGAGPGWTMIWGAVDNTGTLAVTGGDLLLEGPITGSGVLQIANGTAVLDSPFSEDVRFAGSSGTLGLADSQSYTGTITDFSTSGGDTLDLHDIADGSDTTASFRGTKAVGVLTVSDGVHTAALSLVGDYLNSTFALSSDGQGGTLVTDPSTRTPSTSSAFATSTTQLFLNEMASIGAAIEGVDRLACAAHFPEGPPALASNHAPMGASQTRIV